jgi:hypothetical protein
LGLTIDSGHDESNLGGVGGASEMCVDLFGFVLVQAHESIENIVARSLVVIPSLVIGKIVLHGAHWELLLESINLIQEQDDGGLDKPSGVANRVEKGQGLLHTVYSLVFEKQLIVLGNGDQEENGGDILEAVNPLFSFRTLSSDIKHTICEVTNDECGFGNTSGLDTRA